VSAYGISKLMVEHYLDKYRAIYGVDGVALRISNCYGARQQAQKGLGAVTLFARAGLRREPLKLFGAGDVVRDYIHVDDVVDAMIAAGARRNVTGPINIGSGVGYSLREVIAKLEAALGHRFDVHQAPPRRFDVSASVLDVARAQERLGWTPTINLDVGIELLLAELRSELESECGSRSSSIATIPGIFTARKAILGH
jgi:UDP-glucose 4-epimerase